MKIPDLGSVCSGLVFRVRGLGLGAWGLGSRLGAYLKTTRGGDGSNLQHVSGLVEIFHYLLALSREEGNVIRIEPLYDIFPYSLAISSDLTRPHSKL